MFVIEKESKSEKKSKSDKKSEKSYKNSKGRKLKSQRILEVPLNTLVIKAYEKDYKTSHFIDIIAKTDEQLDKIPFSVNIDNYISHWE